MAENTSGDQLKSLKSLDKAHALEKSSSESSLDAVTVVGHECEFVSQPPNRSECPICLLVLREPHQATCCGKIFCKTCICQLRDKKKPCPTCKTEDFSCYPDKGLKQELYSSRVYCPKRSLSCSWQGELGELDKHLHGNGKDPANLECCQFVTVTCSFCSESYPRGELEEHQSNECVKRPFTCTTCNDYISTYDDVLFLHLSICKCRPVDCPNKCGQVMQHQKLEEHLSSECELSEVECEFIHAGCEAKILRRDLPSHMTDNMAAHMTLLARENRQIKTENSQLKAELTQLRKSIDTDKQVMRNCFSRLPPFHISYPWKKYAYWSGVFCYITDESVWNSEPFYSHYGGHELRMKIWCTCSKKPVASAVKGVFLTYELIKSKFEVEPTLFILTSVLDPENGSYNVQKTLKVSHSSSESLKISKINITKCLKYESMEICVERITVLNIPLS